jgi:phage terminase large subunit-like protein
MLIPPRDPTPVRAASVSKFIGDMCVIPQGARVGQPLKLAPFQRELLEAIYDPNRQIRRAFLSMGRKSGKTLLAAALMLNHLCGPSAKHRPNAQLYSCAQSRDQAALIFDAALKMVRFNPRLSAAVRVQESAKVLSCPELGTTYKALSSETTTAFGLNPQFVIFDELGQVRGPRDTLYEALETATAGIDTPLTIVISTQAANDGDLFSMLLDDALGGHDPRTIVRLYAANDNMDPFSEAAIRAANPGYDVFMNKQEVLDMAAAASRMPAREGEYRNYILNQRVSANVTFIAKALWAANGGAPNDLHGMLVYGGLDLSSTSDLTCLVLVANDPITGLWHVHPIFWLPEKGLAERSRHDRQSYDLWAEKGFLRLTPGASVSLEFVAKEIRELFDEYDIQRVMFDRWGMSRLKTCLGREGFADEMLEEKFGEHGQGYREMSPSLRYLESQLLDEKLRHGMHPVLTMCAANAIIDTDPAGNRKLDKKHARGRIDGIVGLAMALAAAEHKPPPDIDVCALIG